MIIYISTLDYRYRGRKAKVNLRSSSHAAPRPLLSKGLAAFIRFAAKQAWIGALVLGTGLFTTCSIGRLHTTYIMASMASGGAMGSPVNVSVADAVPSASHSAFWDLRTKDLAGVAHYDPTKHLIGRCS